MLAAGGFDTERPRIDDQSGISELVAVDKCIQQAEADLNMRPLFGPDALLFWNRLY